MFGWLTRPRRRPASARLAVALCCVTTGLAAMGLVTGVTGPGASAAMASSHPGKSTSSAKTPATTPATASTPANPPPVRPAQLPDPVQDCLGKHGSPAPKGTPWAQQALDFQSVWPFTEGGGITVAVIDSGVDANPQLDGRVLVGPTFVPAPAGPANGDCVGHGTAVAGIIAAAPMKNVSFTGVAPQATILSFKVTNTEQDVSGADVIQAIYDAVQDGAQVINISITEPDTPALSAAVQYAFRHNAVVVAAAGNDSVNSGPGPFYPASYPGVLSVGAVDSSGTLASFANARTPVTVTAPGVDITTTFPGVYPDSYLAGQNGTSFATAFVSGVVALVRARYPSLTVAQVVRRIEETADGAAGPGTGNGLVNPVQAVTAVLPASLAAAKATGRGARVSIDRAVPDRSEKTMAVSVTAGALGAVVLVIAAAMVIPAGRRRRWRPGGDR